MRGAESLAAVGVEELVEGNIVSEVGILVELLAAAVDGAVALVVASKEVDHSVLELVRHVCEVHLVAAPGRTLDLEVVAVVLHSSAGSEQSGRRTW